MEERIGDAIGVDVGGGTVGKRVQKPARIRAAGDLQAGRVAGEVRLREVPVVAGAAAARAAER